MARQNADATMCREIGGFECYYKDRNFYALYTDMGVAKLGIENLIKVCEFNLHVGHEMARLVLTVSEKRHHLVLLVMSLDSDTKECSIVWGVKLTRFRREYSIKCNNVYL